MSKRQAERRRWERGIASNYIAHAREKLRPGDDVILICRVSRSAQRHRGNLDDQEANLCRVAAELGAVVAGVERYVGSGFDPFWLARAVESAKRLGVKYLIAETTDRFIRHPCYHSVTDPDAQAREVDLKEMQRWTKGVILLTDLHPDATPAEVRSYQSRRGQHAKDKRGGRPRNLKPHGKERKAAYLPAAIRMHSEGVTYRAIADELNRTDDAFPNVTHGTIWNWVNAHRREATSGDVV